MRRSRRRDISDFQRAADSRLLKKPSRTCRVSMMEARRLARTLSASGSYCWLPARVGFATRFKGYGWHVEQVAPACMLRVDFGVLSATRTYDAPLTETQAAREAEALAAPLVVECSQLKRSTASPAGS